MSGATLELQDSAGHARLARCIKDPASAMLGIIESVLCGTTNGTTVNQANVSAANVARTTATNVLCVQVLDATGAVMGTSVALADVVGTDGAAAPSKSLLVGGKDGGGLHQDALVGTAGQWLIDFYSNRPGEVTGDDWLKICMQTHLKVAPASLGVIAVTTDTVVLGPVDCSTYGPFWIHVYNNGAALTTCNVEVSSDGTTGWCPLSVKDADETACGLLASGQVGVAYKFGRGLGGFLRVRLSTATATNATAWLVGQM